MENAGSKTAEATEPSRATTGLSPTVKALGVVSLCTDVSSEMVYPINPVFLRNVLHAPAWAIGLIEGIAESTASLLKLYSGWLSDRMGRRKPFTVVGYGMAAFAKPLIAMAGAWWHVLGARFLDRFGKGLRTAPRDALIAENCAPEQRGRAFGFHRSLDTVGAVLGPLLGVLFLRFFPGALRELYLLAFLPALLGVLVLLFFVREHRTPNPALSEAEGIKHRTPGAQPLPSWAGLSPAYRQYLFTVGLFSLGNSSDAFLILRARDLGIGSEHQILLLYALFNVVEAAFGYPAGRLSDRVGRRPLVAAGYTVFALVYLGFATLRTPEAVWGLFVLYGLYYTLTQGVQRALATDLSHPERRGAELGTFHMLVGLAALPASLFAGWLYDHVSHAAPFFVGASTASLAALLLLLSTPRNYTSR